MSEELITLVVNVRNALDKRVTRHIFKDEVRGQLESDDGWMRKHADG